MRNKVRLLLWVLLPGAAGLAAFLPGLPAPGEETVEAVVRPVAPAAGEPSPPAGKGTLPSSQPGPGETAAVDVFAAKTWYVPPPAPSAPPPPPPAQPPVPTAPPLPFTFLGRLDDGATLKAFLLRGEQAYVVVAGQVVDGIYRVESIRAGEIVLTYLPLGITQTLSVGSPL